MFGFWMIDWLPFPIQLAIEAKFASLGNKTLVQSFADVLTSQ
jgi:hypothetical protein